MGWFQRINRAKRDLNRGAIVRKQSLALLAADLTDGDTQQSFDIGAALPAGAILLGAFVDITTGFQNAGDTDTTTADLGIKGGDTDSIANDVDISTTGKTDATIGAKPSGFYGGETLSLEVNSDVNMDTITIGVLEVVAMYIDPADVQVAS